MIGLLFVPFVVLAKDALDAWERRIREALRLSDHSIEKAALYMEIDKSQLVRQLKGDGHLSFTRMMALPRSFWAWLGLLIVEDYGLPKVVARSTRAMLALYTRKRAARFDALERTA